MNRLRGALLAVGMVTACLWPAGALAQGDGATTTVGDPTTSTTEAVTPSTTTATTAVPQPPAAPRIRLVSQTSWVRPGGELRLVVSASDIPDPTAIDVAVSVFPRVASRSDLSASFTGDGLRSALWQLPGGPVHLSDIPAAADGSRTITIPTQAPDQPLDRTRARIQSGIYPVEVQLLSGAGDVVDRLVTHLLAPEVPKDSSRMRVVTVLPISARPAISPEGTRTGPPEGTTAIAAIAAGLASVPGVPVTAAVSPETLTALDFASPATARALAAALADRPLVARPYVPLEIPAVGERAGPVLTAQLDAGTAALTRLLKAPTSHAWVADETIDATSVTELATIGVDELILSATDLAPPPTARTDRPQPVPVPRQPVPVTAGNGRSVRALVADPSYATHTDPATVAADQPLAAHQLLTELAGTVLLPLARGGPVPTSTGLGATVATILPPRAWRPTQAFLTELLTGLQESPILVGADPTEAFAISTATTAPASTTTVGRRGTTTTTTPSDERSLVRLPPQDTRLGRALERTQTTLAAHTSVLPDAAQPDVSTEVQVLAAASADLSTEEQEERLGRIHDLLEEDLGKIRLPGGRDLRLASRAGELPIGVLNDAPSQARVLLRVTSEKLEFPEGPDHPMTLGRQNSTEQVRVRAKTAGAFPLRVTLLSPDGSRVLDVAEYRVRSNSLPGVGIAVSVAAGLVLAFWWGKTLLFQPRGAHARRGAKARDQVGR